MKALKEQAAKVGLQVNAMKTTEMRNGAPAYQDMSTRITSNSVHLPGIPSYVNVVTCTSSIVTRTGGSTEEDVEARRMNPDVVTVRLHCRLIKVSDGLISHLRDHDEKQVVFYCKSLALRCLF